MRLEWCYHLGFIGGDFIFRRDIEFLSLLLQIIYNISFGGGLINGGWFCMQRGIQIQSRLWWKMSLTSYICFLSPCVMYHGRVSTYKILGIDELSGSQFSYWLYLATLIACNFSLKEALLYYLGSLLLGLEKRALYGASSDIPELVGLRVLMKF